MVISKGRVVVMHYNLKDGTGETLETTEGEKPLEFITGKGMIVPGLEKGLSGLQPGDNKTIVVPPSEGYGERDGEAFFKVHRDEVQPGKFEVDGKLRKVFSDGHSETYKVTGFVDDWICIDGNHPWAGKELHYEVEILDVRPDLGE